MLHPLPSNNKTFLFLFFVTATFLAFGAVTAESATNEAKTIQQEAEEAARPADVRVTAIADPSCTRCYDISKTLDGIERSGKAKIFESKTIDSRTDEGKSLIVKYGITRLPAFVLSGETSKLLTMVPPLSSYGSLKEGDFVGQTIQPPYMELADGKIRGDFTVTYVTEKACQTCYDVTKNRQALAQLGMTPVNETTVDRSDVEGRKLVRQYAITTTPTVILKGDLAAYPGFDRVWKNVGTVESDGAYVFRNGGTSSMGTYYDLTSNQAVTPSTTK